MTPIPPAPRVSAAERVRVAYLARHDTDYEFTKRGWDILFIVVTCGFYGYYVFYQLMKRDRDHQRRSLDLLEAATEFAWEQATAQGIAESLRPNFERIAGHLHLLRSYTRDFREPAVWLVILIGAGFAGFFVYFVPIAGIGAILVSGIAMYVGFALIDSDFIRHDAAEGAVQAELSVIYTRLGASIPSPDQHRQKGKHNYAGRIVASFFSCGIYTYWWWNDLMREGNWHLYHCWTWEDGLAGAMAHLTAAPSAN